MASYSTTQIQSRIEKRNRTQHELIGEASVYEGRFISPNLINSMRNMKNENLAELLTDLEDATTLIEIAKKLIKEEEEKRKLKVELDRRAAQERIRRNRPKTRGSACRSS